jgi:hypothetical protein
MTVHAKAAGGREGVRRLFVLVSIVAAGWLAAPLRAADDEPVRQAVTVQEAAGVYSVRAQFQVPQPPAVALAVLTDYARIPQFMPDVRTSVVLERSAGRAVVEQEGVSRLMMFSKRVHLVLEITEGADTLRFRDRCGRSFTSYEGTWRMSARAGGTDIFYELTARPSFSVPEAILKRLLRRDSGRMIESLRQEMAR